jgi:hypothetical protein
MNIDKKLELIYEGLIPKQDVSKVLWYHGGDTKRESLISGDGVDGEGIYLTKNPKRAEMYAKKNKFGNQTENYYVHKVIVKVNPSKVFDYNENIDLRDFNPPWLKKFIDQYGEKASILNGQNAKIYMGWDNNDLKKMGFDAILTDIDLIVLNPSIIVNIE